MYENNLPRSSPDRSPPYSQEAEEHVIACCLLDEGDTVDRCINAGLTPDGFFGPACKQLYFTLVDMRSSKKAVTTDVLVGELMTQKLFEAIGGFPMLMQIGGRTPTTSHAGYFIDKVKELKTLRDFLQAAQRTIEEVYNYTGGIETFTAAVESDFTSIGATRVSGIRPWKDAVVEAERQLNEMLKANNELTPGEISWGFRDFDRAFEPMQPGQLVILGARPSVGKSSLARQIIRAAALNKSDCLIASLEVKDHNIARNIAQSVSGISYRYLKRTRDPAAIKEFKKALDDAKKLTIHTIDDFAATSAKICAQARLLKSKGKLKFVAVDHLQVVPDATSTQIKSSTEAIGHVTKTFKALAGELEVPVMVLSQLNRSSESDNRAPRLHDLRASGDIEQDADKVLFLHRPTKTPEGRTQSIADEVSETPNFYVEATQAKGRDDGTASLGTMFRRETATFYPIQI